MSRIHTEAAANQGHHFRKGTGTRDAGILAMAFLLATVVGYVGYYRFLVPPAPTIAGQAVQVTRGNIVATVSTAGSVVPSRRSQLTFGTSGVIAQVNVTLGDRVKAGQVLAKIDTATLENKLATSRSLLKSAQIKLDDLLSAQTPDEVAAAQSALDSANAKYADLVAGPKDSDIKAAEQTMSTAQSSLSKAQGDLIKLMAGATQDEITAAKGDVDKKQAVLRQAQAAYDKVAWRGDIAARPEASALQQATADYQIALAAYNLKIAPPRPEDLASAQKAVDAATAALASAQAKLDLLKAGPTDVDLQTAQSNVAGARSALALKTGTASDTDIAAAKEAIVQAEINARQAEQDLTKSAIIAPFDGVVSAVNVNIGEQTSNQSYVTVVDTSVVRVDVQVSETDLAKISIGKPAEVSFDALPDTRLTGKVFAMSPNATIQQGVVTFLVSLHLDVQDIFLPAGLTANVNIIVDQRDNVLLVPNRAVKTQNRTRVVDVLAGAKRQTRPVTIGLSNDQMTEIVSGVTEGEDVIIPTTTTASPNVGGMRLPMGGGMAIPK